jgi:hypothetical protein
MGPSPLQIVLVIVIALLLFGAGRFADLWDTLRRKRALGGAGAGKKLPSPPPTQTESEPP